MILWAGGIPVKEMVVARYLLFFTERTEPDINRDKGG
jgi:hypothetical protein